ncbi:hypothetical protein [Oerskovia enterophila]|uniref:hypothetical protein n=1 Tax=Oerskovia enterophila TaxID=43678 RepID=UPI00339324C1
MSRTATALSTALAIGVLAVGTPPASARTEPSVATTPVPVGAPQATQFTASVEGESIGLYADDNGWGSEVAFGQFDFTGSVEVTVDVGFDFTSYAAAPAAAGIVSSRAGRTITISLDEPENITLVFDDDHKGRTLHLFANAPDPDVPDPDDPGVIFIEPGYHDLEGGDDKIVVESGQTLYVAPGAYINGRIVIDHVDDVEVRGRGVVTMDYRPEDHPMIPLTAVRSTNVRISGIIVSRMSTGWSSTLENSSDVSIDNYKVVSPQYASTDALDIINCHDVTVTNSFFRSADDNIPIKGVIAPGYDSQNDPQLGAANHTIDISGSQFWSDANNVITLGAETQASSYHDIRFHDNDVLFSYDDRDNHGQLDERAVMSIASLNSTVFENIVFEDIRVEQAERLIALSFVRSFWFGSLQGNLAWPGTIRGITFRNISVDGSTGASDIRLKGWDTGRQISDVTLDNVSIDGTVISELDDPHLWINSLVSDLTIISPSGTRTLERGPVNVAPEEDYDVDRYAAARDYSSIQGNQGWTYQTWTAAGGAVDMQWDTSLGRWRGPGDWDAIWAGDTEVYLHPHDNDVWLNWTAPRDGRLRVTGTVRKFATHGGDGVRAAIWHDDTQIWPSQGPWQSIAFNDATGAAADATISVQAGDVISFRLNQNATTEADSTAWNPSVRYVDDPPSVTVEARARCVGGRATVAVTARNDGDAAVAIRLSTPAGGASFPAVAPGRSAHQSFATRKVAIASGEARTEVTIGGDVTSIATPHPAVNCE